MTTPPRIRENGAHNRERFCDDMFGFLASVATLGDVASFELGQSPCVLVNGAPQVRQLFIERSTHLRKPEFVKNSNRGHWGDGLTTLEGAEWHARRHVLRRSFRAANVTSRLPTVAACAREMVESWSDGSEIDLLREIRILTARVAARTVLDADVEGYGASEGRAGMVPFAEAYGEDYASVPGGDPTAPLVMVRPRAPRNMDVVCRIVDERIASGERRGDVLSDLLAAQLPSGDKLSRDEIVGEVIQMLYAGHHTIPSVMVNFWRDLSEDVALEQVVAEARILAERAIGTAELADSYCAAAIQESMRLHPPAPILYREAQTAFEVGGFEIEPDVAVWICPQLLHHDPRYFPEPQRFLPDRFLEARSTGTSDGAYLPFGLGPRTCVGNHLALHEMTLIALAVTPHFELTPIDADAKVYGIAIRRRL